MLARLADTFAHLSELMLRLQQVFNPAWTGVGAAQSGLKFFAVEVDFALGAKAGGLGCDGFVEVAEGGKEIGGIGSDLVDDALRIFAGGGELAVIIAIDPNRIRRGKETWAPVKRVGLVRTRDGPMRSTTPGPVATATR